VPRRQERGKAIEEKKSRALSYNGETKGKNPSFLGHKGVRRKTPLRVGEGKGGGGTTSSMGEGKKKISLRKKVILNRKTPAAHA